MARTTLHMSTPGKNQGFFSHLSLLFPVSPTFISSQSFFTNFISLLDHSHQHTNMLLISPIFQNHSLELTLVSHFSACSAVKLERAVSTLSTSSHPSPIWTFFKEATPPSPCYQSHRWLMWQIQWSVLYLHPNYMKTQKSGLDTKTGGNDELDPVPGCFPSVYYWIFQQAMERIRGQECKWLNGRSFPAPLWFLREDTGSLKLNTACEDWVNGQAGYTNMGALPSMPLGWMYRFITV